MASRAADPVSARFATWPLVVVAVVVAAVAVALVGRWERHEYVAGQVRGLAEVKARVGSLDRSSLAGYRVLPQFDCLVYRQGANLLALELCIDKAGRVVEAEDRRATPRRYSLRADPTDSTVRVDRREVDRLLRRMGAEQP